jgi:hypothetical protein
MGTEVEGPEAPWREQTETRRGIKRAKDSRQTDRGSNLEDLRTEHPSHEEVEDHTDLED